MRVLTALFLAVFGVCTADAATLTIDAGRGPKALTTEQLLRRPDARDIRVTGDVSYHQDRTYRAVPMKALLEGVPADANLQFVAEDGFAADIPAALIVDGHGAEAWLAVEPGNAPWPTLEGKDHGAGPFYLVWLHPEAGNIGPEQWPYQIGTVKVMPGPAERFPAMNPAANASAKVKHGFAVFQRNCITCHTLNGQGDAKLGPDLNIPYSPTEYLQAGYLRKLVRNPQDLRHWPQAKMPAFRADVLSDADLDDLVAYLKHMSGRKTKP